GRFMKRKSYTPQFKSQIVLEILKERKSMSQIASENETHVNELPKWKTQFLQEMPQVFEKQNKDLEKMKVDYEKQLESLYSEVGKLTTQLSWLKKKSGIYNDETGTHGDGGLDRFRSPCFATGRTAGR